MLVEQFDEGQQGIEPGAVQVVIEHRALDLHRQRGFGQFAQFVLHGDARVGEGAHERDGGRDCARGRGSPAWPGDRPPLATRSSGVSASQRAT